MPSLRDLDFADLPDGAREVFLVVELTVEVERIDQHQRALLPDAHQLTVDAGGQDRVVPGSLVKANFELYRESKAETDYKEFRDRTHFIIGQDGWEKVADYVLGWALSRTNGSKLTAVSNQPDAWSVQLST